MTTTSDRTVVVDRPGPHLMRISMNRPDALNALNATMTAELTSAFRVSAADSSIRAVVLTGVGRAFCSGLDLRGYGHTTRSDGDRVLNRLDVQKELVELATVIREQPVPVIAAVNGAAVGGGMALALLADIRVMADTATLAPNFVKIGLSAGDLGLSWILPRMVGLSRATIILTTARPISAADALAWALVSEVHPLADLLTATDELAADIAAHSPIGVRMTKEVLRAGLESGFATAVANEITTQAACSMAGDFKEAITAFVEHRSPHFGQI